MNLMSLHFKNFYNFKLTQVKLLSILSDMKRNLTNVIVMHLWKNTSFMSFLPTFACCKEPVVSGTILMFQDILDLYVSEF